MTRLIKVYAYLRLQIGEELAQRLGRCATIDIHLANSQSRAGRFTSCEWHPMSIWRSSMNQVLLAFVCASGYARCLSAQVPLPLSA